MTKVIDQLADGVRLLKVAEDAHVRGDPHATEWYLRSIAHLLVALVEQIDNLNSPIPK